MKIIGRKESNTSVKREIETLSDPAHLINGVTVYTVLFFLFIGQFEGVSLSVSPARFLPRIHAYIMAIG